MRIALIGTRGVPAQYGGFETAVEEIGKRLAQRGHDVVVYCRNGNASSPDTYLGMTLVHLPAVRRKELETLSHTGLSVGYLVGHKRPDVAIVFNAANAPFIPALRARRVPVATHVDGLEWKRSKWGGAGQKYYRTSESLAVRWSDALIADAQGIADYYRDEFSVGSDLISYGAPILREAGHDRIDELGLQPRRYHVVVARFEPENHVALAVEGYRDSEAKHPLIVVGGAPYADDYTAKVRAAAGDDTRIQLIGPIWDQAQLDQLYANALTYVHGHSVGGTNPSLLRAIGAGTSVIAYDVVFNREVLGTDGRYFTTASGLATELNAAEAAPEAAAGRGSALQRRAEDNYSWDAVTDSYEALCVRLASGESQRGTASGRRSSTHEQKPTP